MNRTYIHPRRKYRIKKVNNFSCSICKEVKPSEELEIDHIIPISSGGTNEPSNLLPLCLECHKKKTSSEWDDGTYLKKSNEKDSVLSVQEKLSRVKEFLSNNSSYSYPEIQFMVLNDPLLSTFQYNTTTLYALWKEVNGIKTKKKGESKKDRNILLNLLNNELKMSTRKLSSHLSDNNIQLSNVQIAKILSKGK